MAGAKGLVPTFEDGPVKTLEQLEREIAEILELLKLDV
jgi:hypothetical protein